MGEVWGWVLRLAVDGAYSDLGHRVGAFSAALGDCATLGNFSADPLFPSLLFLDKSQMRCGLLRRSYKDSVVVAEYHVAGVDDNAADVDGNVDGAPLDPPTTPSCPSWRRRRERRPGTASALWRRGPRWDRRSPFRRCPLPCSPDSRFPRWWRVDIRRRGR